MKPKILTASTSDDVLLVTFSDGKSVAISAEDLRKIAEQNGLITRTPTANRRQTIH
jgi:DUF971 family protein